MELYCTGNGSEECLDWEAPMRPEDRGIIPWDRSRVVCVGCLEDALEAEKQLQAEEYELDADNYWTDARDIAVTPWYAYR
jgi:hypothetical protein